jgi:hypothetical protein
MALSSVSRGSGEDHQALETLSFIAPRNWVALKNAKDRSFRERIHFAFPVTP